MKRRGGAYVLVVVLSAIVAVLGTGGLLLRDRVLETTDRRVDSNAARTLARSSAELAFQAVVDGFDVTGASIGAPFVDVDLEDGTLEAFATSISDDGRVALRAKGALGETKAFLDFDVDTGKGYRERALALEPAFYWPLDESINTEFSGVRELIQGYWGVYSWFDGIAGERAGPDGGPAPHFDSIYASAGIGHNSAMASNKITVACWVWLDDARTDTRVILSKDAVNIDRGQFTVYVYNNRVYASIEGRTSGQVIGGATIGVATWTHVLVRIDNEGAALYVNGTLAGQTSSFNPQAQHNTWSILVGVTMALTGTFSHPLYGSVRDIAFFDRALTTDEITDLGSGWNSGEPTIVDGSWRWGVE